MLRRTLIVNDLLRFIYDDIFNIGLLVNLSRSVFVAVSRAASLHFIIMQHRLRCRLIMHRRIGISAYRRAL